MELSLGLAGLALALACFALGFALGARNGTRDVSGEWPPIQPPQPWPRTPATHLDATSLADSQADRRHLIPIDEAAIDAEAKRRIESTRNVKGISWD